jgi:DNA-binding PadR family transcriptional regulator
MLAQLLDGPQHGYALKKRAGLIYGQQEMHNNVVYPLLRRFVGQGWVSQRKRSGERGQTRLIYALTSAGRKALRERVSEFGEDQARSGSAFQLRVGLFSLLDGRTRSKILDARQAFLEKEAQKFQAMKEQIALEKFSGEVVRSIREGIQRELKWIERLGRISRSEEKGSKANRRKGEQR